MADPNSSGGDKDNRNVDTRIACKYGTRCFQKNPLHLQKYKHPPPKVRQQRRNSDDSTQTNKKYKVDTNRKTEENDKVNTNDKNSKDDKESNTHTPQQTRTSESPPLNNETQTTSTNLGRTPKCFDPKDFIKQKFLVDMPDDFYNFWSFCKKLKEKCPQEALSDIGLKLVGPYDVLAGKFYDVPEQPDESYLLHWRYYFDPPEFQTVLKGNDKTGFHIGYFRDSPKNLPVFLASNCANTNGIFKVMGDNIFAAINLYLEDLKKTGDPFTKMHIGRYQSTIKKKAEELKLELAEKTSKIAERDKKIITRSFSKMGIVIPFNKKTQVGYRDLGVSNKELQKLLDNIQKADTDQKQKFLSKLQGILTNASIATDECDFGTGIELGLDIIAHGVEDLNQTASRYLATNYRLIDREEFAQIVEVHMKNRKKGTNLSII